MANATKVEFDEKAFYERLGRVYDSWNKSKSDKWVGADCIVLNLGEADDDAVYQKCPAIHIWFFSYEFPETVILLTSNGVKILSSMKKTQVLKTNLPNIRDSPLPIEFISRDKEPPKDFKTLLESMQKSNDGKVYGTLAKEKPKGNFMDSWVKFLQDSKLKQVDVTNAFSELLAVKDSRELKSIRTAATITAFVLKNNLLPDIETIIDDAQKVTHTQLGERIEKLFEDPTKISKKLQKEFVESCYTPIIQSGGNYDLRPDAKNDDNFLHFGTIICSLGARYKSYCANVARTYLVDPIPSQTETYQLLLDVQQTLISSLKPGIKLGELYSRATEIISNSKPELLDKFTKNCGFGMGIEFRESLFNITAKNDHVVQPGMTFNLAVGFQNIELPPESKYKTYSLLLADTVLVTAEGVEVLTDKAAKKPSDIIYNIESEESGTGKQEVKQEETKPKPKVLPKVAKEVSLIVESKFRESTVQRKEEKNKLKEAEEKRREHQKQLEEKKREEAAARFSKVKKKDASKVSLKEIESYRDPSQYPKDLARKIHIDAQRETIFLPVYGYMVPFHISTIKNASKTDEEFLRINFITPDATVIHPSKAKSTDISVGNPKSIHIKEVTYRCTDARDLNNSLRMIKEIKKRITTREAERRETANLIVQEKLVLAKGRNARLTDVFVRPNPVGRRTTGTLEAHQNGFRFTPMKGENIDILYKNIKHAFFQPAEKELIVLIHFHLHNGIMIGKKKSQDVQFCTEVMEVSQALDGRGYDADELEDEQRERQMRVRLNNEFQTFVRKVEDNNIEFDIPYRDLGFFGVPFRSSVFLQPTVHCLVNLTETPFFVLTLEDVEIAYFERIQFSLRNFDLVFVFKDYEKPVAHINSIGVESLDTIKEWLDQCDIKYYEGTQNLNWNRIMSTVKEDPNRFHTEEGGWAFLNPESSDEEGSDEEKASADEFDPSAEEEEYEDEEAYSEASDEDEFEEEEEDEGEDWEELEEKAMKSDMQRAEKKRERGEYSDESGDEERVAKKPTPAKRSVTPSSTKRALPPTSATRKAAPPPASSARPRRG